MLPINDPVIIAEIAVLHDAYERALVTNDVAALNLAFWESPHVVRYGVNEHLYGAEAMVAYRAEKVPVLVDRRMLRRTISAFGTDAASVMCELSQIVSGQQKHSRQSQTWIRFPEIGWKIVAAHVSHSLPRLTGADTWAGYVDRTAGALHLTLEPAHRDGVIQNMHRAAAVAAPLLEFQLPAPAEIAPVFVPMISPVSTALEIAAAVHTRKITSAALTEQALAALIPGNARLNAFTAITADRARAEAAAVDAAIAAGRDPGPLAGVPYGVKNLFDLAGVVTVAGSKINRDNPPALRDATAVARLKAAGAICLGALNMGEYAYDFVTENAHDGATRNPRDVSRSAGGSSGGSAAAVAAGLVPLSLGTDTNGSIRVPSAFCGIWGIKPTYGRLSRAGSFPFVGSLDHIGPFARTVGDLAVAYDVMQGADSRDPVCTQRAPEPAGPGLADGIGGLRIAVASGYFGDKAAPEAHAGVDAVARALGATTKVELEADATTRARAAAFVITMAEGAELHLESLRRRAGDFDPPIRDRFLAGALLPAAWYLKAQQYRQWWREHLAEVFRHVDVLLAPATPVSATSLGQVNMTLDGVEMLVRPNLGIFTQPISFVGLPVLAAPVQTATMPVAVQLIAAPWREAELFRVARMLERSGVCAAPVATVAA